MRVAFLEIDAEPTWAVASIGPAFLAAYLRAHGHEAVFERVTLDATPAAVLQQVGRHEPDLIAASLTTRQWLRGRQVLGDLRAALPVPVVAGGLHPTFSADAVLAAPGIDFVCLGEGEAALLELVEALASGRRPRDGEIANIQVSPGIRPQLREPLPDLDAVPWMARDFLDERYGVRYMATQRGCPFPCTYCAARQYDELYAGNGTYGRRRSHGDVLAEIDALRDGPGLSYIIFLDDTFTIHRSWVREFCRQHRERGATPFSLHARVETVTPRLLEQLAAAGCRQITYGVESGSERVRRDIMKRQVTDQRFHDVFRWTREAGIHVTANFIIGIPGETRDEMAATLALCEALDVPDFGAFVFYPYPGTALFHQCRREGWLPDDYLERPANHRESILRLPGLTQEDVGAVYDAFTALRGRALARRSGFADDSAAAAQVRADIHHSASVG